MNERGILPPRKTPLFTTCFRELAKTELMCRADKPQPNELFVFW